MGVQRPLKLSSWPLFADVGNPVCVSRGNIGSACVCVPQPEDGQLNLVSNWEVEEVSCLDWSVVVTYTLGTRAISYIDYHL